MDVKKQARRAGLLYVIMGVIAPIGLLVVPGQIIVSRDAAATAQRVRDSESLVRLGMATELIHQAIAIYLLLSLYKLFKPVSESLAKQLVVLGALVSVPIMFVNQLNWIAALTLTSGAAWLAPFNPAQLDTLTYLFVRLHGQGIVIASIFWGLWLFPFGLLVIRSGFIPRWIGFALFVAGIGYVVNSFVALCFPQYSNVVSNVTLAMGLGELPVMFWLLIWGARTKPTPATA